MGADNILPLRTLITLLLTLLAHKFTIQPKKTTIATNHLGCGSPEPRKSNWKSISTTRTKHAKFGYLPPTVHICCAVDKRTSKPTSTNYPRRLRLRLFVVHCMSVTCWANPFVCVNLFCSSSSRHLCASMLWFLVTNSQSHYVGQELASAWKYYVPVSLSERTGNPIVPQAITQNHIISRSPPRSICRTGIVTGWFRWATLNPP